MTTLFSFDEARTPRLLTLLLHNAVPRRFLPVDGTRDVATVRVVGIAVLGPVGCEDDIAFGRRDRAVLTALALCVGRAVTADQLADAVWGEAPPSRPTSLSRAASCGCAGRWERPDRDLPAGLPPDVPADEVDFRQFERLVGRGRELLALGEPERAAYVFGEALDLWRGPAFEDLESWDLAVIEAGTARRAAAGGRGAARRGLPCAAGRHLEVLGEAEGMVRAAPLRERRWQLLALAQYQAGRQTEALRTLQRRQVAAGRPARARSGPGAGRARGGDPAPGRLAAGRRAGADDAAPAPTEG